MRRPRISVLLPVYNGENYLGEAVNSILGQTFEDFELIAIDDGSADRSAAILQSIDDPRMVVIQNESNRGLVWSLNRAASVARGEYLARLDADDIALPTRLARQVAVLDGDPGISLLGGLAWDLLEGRCYPPTMPYDPDPTVIRWMMHITNPLPHPSMMFRADLLSKLGTYMREEFFLAEDFDFSHRVSKLGGIWLMPERLILYRRHKASLTSANKRELLVQRTAAVLAQPHAELVGAEAAYTSEVIASELMAVGSDTDRSDRVNALAEVLERLLDRFLEVNRVSDAQASRLWAITGEFWRRRVQHGVARGLPLYAVPRPRRLEGSVGPSWPELLATSLRSMVPAKPLIRAAVGRFSASRPRAGPVAAFGTRFTPIPPNQDSPPRLFVVVDTEAEFDWGGPFERSGMRVGAMRFQERAQSIFDGFGLRPIYVVDYAIAAQPEGYEPLRAILERHSCMVGAHLHPWINPPFIEDVSERNSYPGNLPADLERAKLEVLVNAIEAAFGISPLFYKAGRFGVGPSTYATLARLGFAVDLSILPGADMRATGGPDFVRFRPIPYRVAAGGILSLPVTRGSYGVLPAIGGTSVSMLFAPLAQRLHVPGTLRGLKLLNAATLTPEGVDASEQMALIRHLVRRGFKDFTLYYHSPSVVPGNTPYVRNEADLARFLSRLETVCDFFFNRLGGLPGNPADLVAPPQRRALWPRRAASRADTMPEAAPPRA
ncbi:MAG TPA: glycosyltransferase [Acetobacteraceae bacterium]|nr:glycosyltransferase [Acetobacteraceae bacterium]